MASTYFDERRQQWTVRFRWPVGRQGTLRTLVCDNERTANHKAAAITKLVGQLTAKDNPFRIPANVEDEVAWIVSGGTKGFREVRQSNGKNATVREMIDTYLGQRAEQVRAGEISAAMLSDDKYQLDRFAVFCSKHKATKLVDAATPANLTAHRAYVASRSSPDTLWHAVKAVGRFVRWAWRNEHLETLPRILDDYVTARRSKPNPKFFTVDEIKSMYAEASPRMKLYVVLALNCAWTQIDLATLTHDMIDWQTGIVTRERHKTGIPSGPKLWPISLQLLKEHATEPGQHPDNLVLLTEQGNVLAHNGVDETGNPTRVDSIQAAFNRLKTKCKIDGRTFRCFRSTGAQLLSEQFHDDTLTRLYLAHSQDGMLGHYTRDDFSRLHVATDWLCGHLGFGKSARKRKSTRKS